MLTGVAYAIPLVWIVSLFVAGGRTPYDRISGTTVVRGAVVTPQAPTVGAEADSPPSGR